MDGLNQDDKQGAATPEPSKSTAALPPSKMPEDQLIATLKSWWRKDGPHARKWREGDETTIGAKDSFDFVAGRQWTPEDQAFLHSQRRVPITFNRVLPTIATITGIEINSRHDTVFIPKTSALMSEQGRMVVKANEVLSQASRAFADECDAEDHQSEAFRDSVICGMGWTEARVDYDIDPMGAYTEAVVNPLEMAWDYRAREKNLTDTQRRWHMKTMSMHEARAMFPDVDPDDLSCAWARADVETGTYHIDEQGHSKAEEPTGSEFDAEAEVHVLRVQWWEYEATRLVAHPDKPNEPEHMTEEEFAKLTELVQQKFAAAGVPPPNIPSVPGRRRAFYETYVGAKILQKPARPQFHNGFTLNCITGIPDRNRGHWFGLVYVMRDPQRFANSWLSQTQHILNTTAKGGIIAEEDAFVDPRKAEEDYAKPDSIVMVTPGAIGMNKIMQKPGVGITAGHANLMQFAVSSIRDVTGINLELLGLRETNQPGVLEAQRKQAALTILAPWFDSLRRFRKQVGRCRLFYIQKFLCTPGRMIRIAGDDGYKLVPLLQQDVIGEHDIVISDAPTSPNQKQETWGIMSGLLPIFGDKVMSNPKLAMVVMEHSPLPSAVVDAFKEAMSAPPSPEEQAAQQIAQDTAKANLQLTQAKVGQTQASATQAESTALVNVVKAMGDAMMSAMTNQAQLYGEEIRKFIEAQRGQATPLVSEGEAIEAQQSNLPGIQGMPAPGVMPQLPMPPDIPVQGGNIAAQIPTVQPNYIEGQANAGL